MFSWTVIVKYSLNLITYHMLTINVKNTPTYIVINGRTSTSLAATLYAWMSAK